MRNRLRKKMYFGNNAQVSVLRVKKGDVLVISIDQFIPTEIRVKLVNDFKESLGLPLGVNVAVLQGGAKLTAITRR